MVKVFSNSWALLLGMLLLMVGNGLQGTLLGIRGEIEGFSTSSMSLVMSAYFMGFLGGSRLAPGMIRRVGHVRVFAALASFISAVLILYPTWVNPYIWAVERLAIGFCFSGVYVTAESWLNNDTTNETRGQTLSAYMIVQMLGIVLAQMLLLAADPSGFVLFIIPSVLVSISFAPILLSISPTPAFEATQPMSLRQLVQISPLGCVGIFLLGGVFSAQFGMSAVYGAEVGLSVAQISLFAATFYIFATLLQYPLGWLSDRMDRRLLILMTALVACSGALIGYFFSHDYVLLLVAAGLIGGFSNPLYSLLIAHANDYLDFEDMAAASGGLVFITGIGAISGPFVIGGMMELVGPHGYFAVIAALLILLAGYAGYRMTQRPAMASDETAYYMPISPGASVVAVELAQELAIDVAKEESAEV